MDDIIIQFRQVFLSPKNTKHIVDVVETKMFSVNQHVKLDTFMSILVDLQKYIYDTFSRQIFNDLKMNGRNDLEEFLVSLNKLTINKFELLLEQKGVFAINEDLLSTNTESPKIVEQQNDTDGQGEENTSITDDAPSAREIKYYHFFSKDASLKNGRYTFPINMQKLNSICMTSFDLECNIYNINETNNRLTIEERGKKIVVAVPLGCYNISELLDCLEKCIEQNTQLHLQYKFVLDRFKNKVCISSEPSGTFNVFFTEHESMPCSLNEILGFKKKEYINNSKYIAENHHTCNILENVFVKLFLNDKEVCKHHTTNGFTYFQMFQIDLNCHFGNTFKAKLPYEPFDIDEDINLNTVSFELYVKRDMLYTRAISYQAHLEMEKCL